MSGLGALPSQTALISFGLGVLFMILGTVAISKEPSGMMQIAGKGIFSPWYYVGRDGIYKGKKLFLRWSEISNIFVIHVYEIARSNVSPRTIQTGFPRSDSTIYQMGTWRVLTKDGRQIDINNVMNPKEMLEYVKNVYLK